MTRYIRFLDEVGAEDLPQVGGKGANLGEMTRAGLPVPPGFCLTADAYRDFIAASGLEASIHDILAGLNVDNAADVAERAAAIRRLIAARSVPPAMSQQIVAGYGQLAQRLEATGAGSLPVAVRSSATAEDLPTASFAGQQDTYLHVRGEAALLERVSDCWASLWTARAVTYRTRQGFDHKQVALSVVVQAMIDSEIAGILFTANPVNDQREEMVINASWGLGEAIVSGLVTPDTVTVRKSDGAVLRKQIASKEQMIVSCPAGGTEAVSIAEAQRDAEALSVSQIAGLITLGRQVESHYQTPQDIEWAFAHGRFYLLQARPITGSRNSAQSTTPLIDGPASGEYSRTMFVEIFPNALSPCFASAIQPMFQDMLRFTFRTLGFTLPVDMESVTLINGQPYFSRAYVTATLQPLSLPVRERLVSQFISPFGRHEQAMRGELSRAYLGMLVRMLLFLRRLPSELRDILKQYRAAIVSAQRLPVWELSDEEIVGHIHQLALRDASHILSYDFLMIALLGITYQMLGTLLKPYYGDDVEEVRARLISGVTGNVTMETNKHLWDLAKLAKASPTVCGLLRTREPADVLIDLAQEPAADDFLAVLDTFLTTYGHREIRMDVMYPTWSEDPTPVLSFVRSYLDADEAQSPHRQQERLVKERLALTEEVKARLRRSLKGRALLPLFDWVLHQTQTHTRERDTIHFELTRLLPPMRVMLRELGKRWLQAGVIDQRDDVFFLTLEQMAAIAGASASMQSTILAARAAHEASQARGWPDLIRDGREIWQSEGESVEIGTSVEGKWQGVAGSPHVVTGVARIIRGPEEFHCLEKGEVLVAPSTDPAWTPLFALASAVVTEVGGILSHGAIVAREYGIPAVMGVRGITASVHTGQMIQVDGNRGVVRLAF